MTILVLRLFADHAFRLAYRVNTVRWNKNASNMASFVTVDVMTSLLPHALCGQLLLSYIALCQQH